MRISQRGIDLIKKYEGCRLTAYKPIAAEKYWTIGWGHYGADVTQGMKITQEQADKMLVEDLKVYENYVNKTGLNLNQNQFDALTSFTYNCGQGNLQRLVKNRTLDEIPDHIEAYNKGANGQVLAGLVRRRKEEKELYLTPMEAKEMLTLEEALNYLHEKGLLDKPEHWKYMADNVKDLPFVFIKWANSVSTYKPKEGD